MCVIETKLPTQEGIFPQIMKLTFWRLLENDGNIMVKLQTLKMFYKYFEVIFFKKKREHDKRATAFIKIDECEEGNYST